MNITNYLKEVAQIIISFTRYPLILRYFINNIPVETTLKIKGSAEIKSFVILNGDVNIGERCIIERGTQLSGETNINPQVNIGKNVSITGETEVGRGTSIGKGSDLVGPVSIGRYNAIGPEVLFQGNNHTTRRPSQQVLFYKRLFDTNLPHRTKGGIELGSDVWIGRRAIILPGVKIGHGAIVGAGSVVTKDVEPYSVVAGVPAEKIKWRFSESTREELLQLQWWEWDEEEIADKMDYFTTPLE